MGDETTFFFPRFLYRHSTRKISRWPSAQAKSQPNCTLGLFLRLFSHFYTWIVLQRSFLVFCTVRPCLIFLWSRCYRKILKAFRLDCFISMVFTTSVVVESDWDSTPLEEVGPRHSKPIMSCLPRYLAIVYFSPLSLNVCTYHTCRTIKSKSIASSTYAIWCLFFSPNIVRINSWCDRYNRL